MTGSTAERLVGRLTLPAPIHDVFALAKEFTDLPLDEIDALLESRVHEVHEVRVGAGEHL